VSGGISLRKIATTSFLLFFAASASLLAIRRNRSARRARQPISFNHQKHVKDLELPCSTCHEFFEKETFSGLPSAEVCASCHLEPQGKSEEEKKLVRLLQRGASLDWKPLFRQPAHVFYSHRRHVMAAKLDCGVCHGGIAQTREPPLRVRTLRMKDCLDCHRRRGVSMDCTACHR
jgi:hypothetical protein